MDDTAAPLDVHIAGMQLTGEIGSGGMATVYAAVHPEWGEVAVKVLRDDAHSRHRQRFLEEIRALSRLRHLHIVRIYAAGSADGRAWIAMQRVTGGSLLRRIKERGPMGLNELVLLGSEAASGLSAAHALGIVHRDIKPQNILLDEDDSAMICDFGIARRLLDARTTLTRTGDRLGTLTYMSPEQRARPHDVDERTDVYALGVTLYAAATGRRPPDLSLAGRSPELLDRLPEPIRPVILKACAYKVDDRYPSADAFRTALLALL